MHNKAMPSVTPVLAQPDALQGGATRLLTLLLLRRRRQRLAHIVHALQLLRQVLCHRPALEVPKPTGHLR